MNVVFALKAFRTCSGPGPPLTRGLAHFPQPYSSPPRCCCPAAASTRPPPSTTRQRGPCTTSTTRAVSHRPAGVSPGQAFLTTGKKVFWSHVSQNVSLVASLVFKLVRSLLCVLSASGLQQTTFCLLSWLIDLINQSGSYSHMKTVKIVDACFIKVKKRSSS